MTGKPEVKKKAEPTAGETPKCFCCGVRIRSAADGVRSGGKTLCASCYETLLNPFPKLCCAGC